MNRNILWSSKPLGLGGYLSVPEYVSWNVKTDSFGDHRIVLAQKNRLSWTTVAKFQNQLTFVKSILGIQRGLPTGVGSSLVILFHYQTTANLALSNQNKMRPNY